MMSASRGEGEGGKELVNADRGGGKPNTDNC